MAKKKFYAVKAGRVPGIYDSWDKCSEQVKGFAGAEYKGFGTMEQAQEYLGLIPTLNKEPIEIKRPYAFVDGSFNAETGIYGFGGFIHHNDEDIYFIGRGKDVETAEMRNVAGEILGSMYAMRKAKELGLKELDINYDYQGIEKWANGEWRANKPETKMYAARVHEYRNFMDVQFTKVDAHTGVDGNEMADQLAKFSVGLLDACPVDKYENATPSIAIPSQKSVQKNKTSTSTRRTPYTDEELRKFEEMEDAYFEAQCE